MEAEKQIFYIGDANPLEHGGIWFTQTDETSFQVLAVTDTNEGGMILESGHVDVSDSWIDWEQVKKTVDLKDDAEPHEKAWAAWWYYGSINFGGSTLSDDKNIIKAILKYESLNYENPHENPQKVIDSSKEL